MKANRSSILRDEDAVSPVIAVILMVAITVVLAATVFVLVSDIGQNAGAPPTNVSFDSSETDDNLTVTSAPNADWQQLEVRFNTAGISWRLNSAALAYPLGASADTWYPLANATDLVDPSDYVHFCSPAAKSNVKISIQDKEAKSLIGTFDFSSIGTNC